MSRHVWVNIQKIYLLNYHAERGNNDQNM